MKLKETERILISFYIISLILALAVYINIISLPDELSVIFYFPPFILLIALIINRRRILSKSGEEAEELRKEMYEKAQKRLKYFIIWIVVLLVFTILFPFILFGDSFGLSSLTLNLVITTIAILMCFGGLIWSVVIMIKAMKEYPDGWKMDPKSEEVKRIRKEVNKKFIPAFILTFLGLLFLFYSILIL